ncbi:uncharacterized protein si:dkey-121a11.3 [Trichomycterus rosablanca]|uniref:uncharacterized protein si:dkey-121a11.3 n=1 Tax=Trichomycterus rosablanca TaxID=2290929 RepID=UPI002F35C014
MEGGAVTDQSDIAPIYCQTTNRSDQKPGDQHLSSPYHERESSTSSYPSSCVQLQEQSYAILALRSKLKGVSKCKAVRKPPSNEETSCKGGWGSSSSDEDVGPYDQTSTCQTMLTHKGNYKSDTGCRKEAKPENLTDNIAKPWAPQQGFWSPNTRVFNQDGVPKRKGPGNGLQEMEPSVENEMQESNSEDSSMQSCMPSEQGLAGPAGHELWRAESLESICSSGSTLSLAERVEMNRSMLRQMLQKAQNISSEGHQAPVTNQTPETQHKKAGPNNSDWDSGISVQYCERSQRSFVLGAELPLSPRHEQAKRLLERASMKNRSNPLKADHTILPVQRDKPELLSRVGAPVQQTSLVGSDQVVVGLGSLSDSSSSDSAGSSHRRRSHGQSPTRVRFQDESENDAEVRYLERQRRRAGQRVQEILGPKPNLSSYVNNHRPDDAETWKYKIRSRQENIPKANGHYEANTTGQQYNSCGAILDRGPFCSNGDSEGRMVPCWVAPTLPNRLVRIEQIKETYIDGSSPVIVESDGTHCRAASTVDNGRGTLQKANCKSKSRPEADIINANGLTEPESPGTTRHAPSSSPTALPPNPYAPESLTDKKLHSPASLKKKVPPSLVSAEVPGAQQISRLHHPHSQSLQAKKPALKLSKDGLNSQQMLKLMPSPQYYPVQNCGKQPDSDSVLIESASNPKPFILKHSEVRNCSNHRIMQRHGSQPGDLEHDLIRLEVPLSPAKNTHTHQNNGQVQDPFSTDQQGEDSASLLQIAEPVFEQREGRAQQALRRFFSAMGLNSGGRLGKSRSSSMEQLGPASKPSAHFTDPNPQRTLKKTPSLQSLRLGSPFTPLKKSSSVQNLHCAKRKLERCNAYTPGDQPCSPALSRGLLRALSVEDVGSPSAMRSVGKITQVCPDGTILLELYRPPEGPFGFLISRGKGRTDSGVYVEDMGESSTQKLYAGLLGVGDEILEVNGEKVAGLSLDLVTQMMIQNSTASIRVLRHRPPHR